jgi:hypothetical protein
MGNSGSAGDLANGGFSVAMFGENLPGGKEDSRSVNLRVSYAFARLRPALRHPSQ